MKIVAVPLSSKTGSFYKENLFSELEHIIFWSRRKIIHIRVDDETNHLS